MGASGSLVTWETKIGRIVVQGQSGEIILETPHPHHLQNNQSKMDWRHDSSSRVPVLQARSPEFKNKQKT
jgi:hypothetical protein